MYQLAIYILILIFMASFFLLGMLVALPKAWPRLDTRRRVLSLVLLAAMLATNAFGVGLGLHAASDVKGGLLMVSVALVYWAFEFCEWELPKSMASDPAARHERRVYGGITGVALLLMGGAMVVPRAAHAAWISLLVMTVGFALLVGWWIPRLRAALLRRF